MSVFMPYLHIDRYLTQGTPFSSVLPDGDKPICSDQDFFKQCRIYMSCLKISGTALCYLLEGKLKEFNALVGDNACHVRGTLMLVIDFFIKYYGYDLRIKECIIKLKECIEQLEKAEKNNTSALVQLNEIREDLTNLKRTLSQEEANKLTVEDVQQRLGSFESKLISAVKNVEAANFNLKEAKNSIAKEINNLSHLSNDSKPNFAQLIKITESTKPPRLTHQTLENLKIECGKETFNQWLKRNNCEIVVPKLVLLALRSHLLCRIKLEQSGYREERTSPQLLRREIEPLSRMIPAKGLTDFEYYTRKSLSSDSIEFNKACLKDLPENVPFREELETCFSEENIKKNKYGRLAGPCFPTMQILLHLHSRIRTPILLKVKVPDSDKPYKLVYDTFKNEYRTIYSLTSAEIERGALVVIGKSGLKKDNFLSTFKTHHLYNVILCHFASHPQYPNHTDNPDFDPHNEEYKAYFETLKELGNKYYNERENRFYVFSIDHIHGNRLQEELKDDI